VEKKFVAKSRLWRKFGHIGQIGQLVCGEKFVVKPPLVCCEKSDISDILINASTGYPQAVDKVVDKLWITK
jgi:hypothetical protein